MKRAVSILALIAVVLLAGFGSTTAQTIDQDIKVSVTFDDTPIGVILRMLAAQNDLNLVVSSDVDGDISINLDQVSLAAALDAILLPNGYNYFISEGIIIVKAIDQKVVGELAPKTYRLKYIDAAAAAEVIKPLLTTNGTVTPLKAPTGQTFETTWTESSYFVIIDTPRTHAAVANLLAEIDKKKNQISVEVKIIETNLNEDEKLGINWPKSVSASIAGVSSISSSTEESSSNSEAAVMPLEDGNWQLGYLSIHQLDFVIDYLEQRNQSKLLSNPSLTMIENETATIEVQTVIPIQTINRFSEGAVIQDIVTFQDEEVGISLKVTPRINDDSTITLRVNPIVEEIIGYTGSPDNQKPITSERSISTTVIVGNSETVVLGGLLKETSVETEHKVFLLGSLPILGPLFTHKTTEKKTTDLLILITPRILR